MNGFTAEAIYGLYVKSAPNPGEMITWGLMREEDQDWWARFAMNLRDEFRAGSSPASRGASE